MFVFLLRLVQQQFALPLAVCITAGCLFFRCRGAHVRRLQPSRLAKARVLSPPHPADIFVVGCVSIDRRAMLSSEHWVDRSTGAESVGL